MTEPIEGLREVAEDIVGEATDHALEIAVHLTEKIIAMGGGEGDCLRALQQLRVRMREVYRRERTGRA